MTTHPYIIDVVDLKEDIALALGATGGITRATPCWKCGATQPAHYCHRQSEAKQRLLQFADAETQGNEPLRKWAPEPSQRLVIEVVGDNPDFATEMLAKAVERINAARPGGGIVLHSEVEPNA